MKGAPAVDGEESTTALGDWFANALFWRPQVALLVNSRTLLPVFMEFAPASTLLKRARAAIEAVLRRHGVDETFLATERKAMGDVQIAPTNDRRVVGVMNEFAFHSEWPFKEGQHDLEALSLRMSSLIIGKLDEGSPDRALAAVMGGTEPPAKLIAFPGGRSAPAPSAQEPATGDVFQLKVTLLDTKPPIWRRVLVDGSSALDPACIDGWRACPPEDCGGTWGYRELLEILADPTHHEHDERSEWLDRPFDPEAFDPTEFDDNLRNGRLAAFDDEMQARSGSEGADRDHGDAVVSSVAVAGAGDDAENGRPAGLAGVDDITEPQERGSAFLGEAGAELDLERAPAAVDQLHDGVDLNAVVVSIVEHLAVEWLGEHPETANLSRTPGRTTCSLRSCEPP